MQDKKRKWNTKAILLVGVVIMLLIPSAFGDAVPYQVNWNVTGTYSISGYVRDTDGVGINLAHVTNNINSVNNYTDINGYYILTGIGNNTYTIQATKAGYISNTTIITVSGASETNVDITLTTSAVSLKATIGSTWINWTWDGTGDKHEVWVDGQFEANTTVNQMILTDVKPREEHEIRVFNNGTLIAKGTATTFYPFSLFYLITGLSMGTMLFTLFLKHEMFAIVLGTITFIFAIFGAYISFPMHLSSFSYIFAAIFVIAFVWILTAAFSMIQSDKIQEDFI